VGFRIQLVPENCSTYRRGWNEGHLSVLAGELKGLLTQYLHQSNPLPFTRIHASTEDRSQRASGKGLQGF
jgi:hypothetical protein